MSVLPAASLFGVPAHVRLGAVGKVVKLKDAHGAVPDDHLGLLDNLGKAVKGVPGRGEPREGGELSSSARGRGRHVRLGRVGANVQAHGAVGDALLVGGRAHGGVGIKLDNACGRKARGA